MHFIMNFNLFFGHSHSIWKSPSQGSNPSWSCDPCHSCSNARSLTHSIGPGIEVAPLQRQARSLIHFATVGTPGYTFFFFFFFLGPHLPHMDVPRQGSNRSCSCWPMPQPHGIQAASATYTTAHGNERGQGSNLHPHGY